LNRHGAEPRGILSPKHMKDGRLHKTPFFFVNTFEEYLFNLRRKVLRCISKPGRNVGFYLSEYFL
jgi:hypothetical protein